MGRPLRATKLTLILLLLVFALPTFSCSGPNKESIAVKSTREWVGSNSTTISGDVARIVINRFPDLSLFSSQISDEIKEKAVWRYPDTEKLDENTYKVTVNCSSTIDITSIGTYETSVNLHLTIDTSTKEVKDWSIDEDSFNFLGSGNSMAMVIFDGWYVGNTRVDTASKTDIVTARINIVGGASGSYTLTVKRNTSGPPDKDVFTQYYDYDGSAGIMEVSFTPPYITDEKGTIGYLIDLQDDSGTVWTLLNSYPPRLTVG